MTDDEFKARFMAAFSQRCVDRYHRDNDMAAEMANVCYEGCPREYMADQWRDEPEGAAVERFDQVLANG